MRFPVRMLAAGAIAVAMPMSVALSGGMAGAVTQVTGTCSSLSGSESSQTLSGCNDTSDTCGSGTITTTLGSGGTGTASISWASGKTTTETFKYKEYTGSKDKCPAMTGDTALAEAKDTSKVTGGTATDLIGKKKLKSTDCAYNTTSGIIVVNYPGDPVPF
jgi:hypothetical protein